MTTHNSTRGAVRRALHIRTATAMAVAFPVHAADETIQEIVVTGSRISVPNLQSISPVTAISAAQRQHLVAGVRRPGLA